MSDFERECPNCGRRAQAVLDVPSIGTDGPVEWYGEVHAVPIARTTGNRWRLYVHGGTDGQ